MRNLASKNVLASSFYFKLYMGYICILVSIFKLHRTLFTCFNPADVLNAEGEKDEFV
jgi:hypothetical protein